MRLLSVLLLLFAFGCTLPACAQKTTVQKVKIKKASKKAVAAKAVAKPTVAVGPVLTFERTPCFGPCPAYAMQVYADGRVAYEGRRAVPMMGTKELTMPVSTLSELLKMTKEAHFEQFDKRYSRNTSDLPSTIIGVRQPNGQLKTVVIEEGAPETLNLLVAALTTKFDALAQLPVVSDR